MAAGMPDHKRASLPRDRYKIEWSENYAWQLEYSLPMQEMDWASVTMCLSVVRALDRKRLELSTPKLVDM